MGRSSTAASRRREQFKGLEDGYGYGDAGPPQPQQQRLLAAPPSGAPLQDRRVLLLVVGTSAFIAAAGGQRRRPPIPVTNPLRHPPLPVEEGFESANNRVNIFFFESQDLNALLQHPLQPKTFSRPYLAGAGISPLLQKQLEELSKRNVNSNSSNDDNKGSRFVIIGHDRVEPLQALQDSGQEICVNMDKQREKRRLAKNWRRKKHEEKKSTQEQKRKDRRSAKERD
ncbi:DEAD-box ATP-dependent RNA helicase 13-like [Hordeum vulgare subsp. vulgare]|uniref:DEAD-box ATP-dependent RNA helicase 13-like n=1 Tax=Hordeum vulgare subsp. vulgare TaxID=112509 RepID=UPI001D1A4A9C|nr:DEAD-box ATP-dependent RNA helicase 13-like [Hordeum vulgare subsp. vulgare]